MSKREWISYSCAIGIWNILFTCVILFLLHVSFGTSITIGRFLGSYVFGYFVLWIINLEVVLK